MPIFHTDSFHTASNSNIRANLPASGSALGRPACLPRESGGAGVQRGRWEAEAPQGGD